jgi:hypothetical protein
MTNLTLVRPAPIAIPRGADWAARAAVTFFDFVRRALVRRPAGLRSRAAQVEAVRRYADALRATDPGMAADLYAAADRHEIAG